MSFNGYLTNKDITDLVQAGQAGGIIGGVRRDLLLDGIPGAFASSLSMDPAPLAQFNLDLVAANRVERMADGQVPIVTLLENAAAQLKLRSRTEARAFEQMLSRVRNSTSGVRNLPPVATLKEVTENEAIIGFDEMVDVTFLRQGLDVIGAVARILVPRFEDSTAVTIADGSPWVMKGTAWLIAPDIAITNHHVINARRDDEPLASAVDLETQALNSVLEFDFDARAAAVTKATITQLLAHSADLDYALIRIASPLPRHVPKLMTQRLAHDATSRLALNIIQHPRGEPKRIAFRNNLVSAADAQTVRYFTDTDHGSSGSPVCDDQWRVVALHRGAEFVSNVKYQGRTTAYVNFGSQIQAVLEDVRAKSSGAAAQIAAAQVD